MARYFLALDAGTGSIRAILFDTSGRVTAQAGREWTHRSIPEYPGSMEFECEENWSLTVECIQQVLSKVNPKQVAAVSSTSMREGIVVYDQNRRELWACANVDARAVEQVRYLRSKGDDFEYRMYKESGQTFALGAAPRLLWLKDYQPDLYERAYAVCMLSDWLLIRLGAPFVVDPSNGGTTGLFSLSTRNWSEDLIRSCGLKSDMFNASVVESGAKIGSVTDEAADQTGIPAGTPLIMGGGDAQLGSVGVGAVNKGDVAIFGGTFWQQEMCIDQPTVDESGKLRVNFHAVPGTWQMETIAFFVGMAARWFRDAMCPDIIERAAKEGSDAYAILEAMAAEAPPGSNGVIPIFSDAMNYINWRHAAPSFLNLGLDPEKYNRATLFRSLQENGACVARANLEQIERATGVHPNTVLFAGGAAKGRLWPQIVADVLQIPIAISRVSEATALGAAMCAAVGVGDYSDIGEAVHAISNVRELERIDPQEQNKDVYETTFGRWREAYPAQLELANKGVTEHMWIAPGE